MKTKALETVRPYVLAILVILFFAIAMVFHSLGWLVSTIRGLYVPAYNNESKWGVYSRPRYVEFRDVDWYDRDFCYLGRLKDHPENDLPPFFKKYEGKPRRLPWIARLRTKRTV